MASVVALVGACSWILPERFAVNAPIGHLLFGRGVDAPPPEVLAGRMQAPPGFALSMWAEGVRGARVLRFTPAGDLLVSAPVQNSILLLERDRDGDGRADGHRVLVSGLQSPYGIELHERWLYVGEAGALSLTAVNRRSRFMVDGLWSHAGSEDPASTN